MIAETITSTARPTQAAHPQRTIQRMEAILIRELSFVPNTQFVEMQEPDAWRGCHRVDQVEEDGQGPTVKLRPGLPAHLLRLCEASLMSVEEEVAAFRRMNYLKYFYNHKRMFLNNSTVSEEQLDLMDDLLERYERIRNDIVRSSIRLVISIVKKYCTPHCVFDDLLSDGYVSLLRAVDNFDFARGFRFSTYATRIIHRDLWRAIARDQTSRARFNTGNNTLLEGRSDTVISLVHERDSNRVVSMIDQLLNGLDERERMIVSSRFGLESSGKKETFSALGKQLGISKERVRQLAERAVNRLRNSAQELGLEEEQWIA